MLYPFVADTEKTVNSDTVGESSLQAGAGVWSGRNLNAPQEIKRPSIIVPADSNMQSRTLCATVTCDQHQA